MPLPELRCGRLQPKPRPRWSRGDRLWPQKQPGGRAAKKRVSETYNVISIFIIIIIFDI
jgi:hypothetical protein